MGKLTLLLGNYVKFHRVCAGVTRLQWARIVDRAADIVTSYDEISGCILHQAYYRLVSEGLIPHTAPTYRRLSRILHKLTGRGGSPSSSTRRARSTCRWQVVVEWRPGFH
ncbi:hypothetical protein ACFY0A_45910 [Streptomyces sp. NPDC001698]|uniref:hypothetical protein n=1 Tax=Streptomyces sp. NPDC001698 TaxID=3364601 RepID=UPI00368B6729